MILSRMKTFHGFFLLSSFWYHAQEVKCLQLTLVRPMHICDFMLQFRLLHLCNLIVQTFFMQPWTYSNAHLAQQKTFVLKKNSNSFQVEIRERIMKNTLANLRRQVESQCIVGNKPTLTRTIPASFKSSTKDLKLRTT